MRQYDPRHERKSGLTIVELIVAVGIVSLLAALLLPLYAAVKERGQSIACLSAIRQIAISMALYGTDNSEAVPTKRNVSDAYWMHELRPYLRSGSSLRCPRFSPEAEGPWVPSSGYAVNGCLRNADRPADESSTILLAETANVSTIGGRFGPGPIWITELAAPDEVAYPDGLRLSDGQQLRVSLPHGSKRHRGAGNYAMLDTHAKSLRAQQVRHPATVPMCKAPARGNWVNPTAIFVFVPMR